LVLVALSLVLLGCGKSDTPQPAAKKEAKPEAKPAAPGEPAKAAPPAAGGVREVVIGFTSSVTGKLNVEATRQINGVNLWLEQANAAGIKLKDGSTVKFTAKYYDDESKKERVQELYTKLISGDKADFLISPYSSGLADAAAVISQQYNKIMLTAGAASDSTYKRGYTLIFQTYTPASRYLTSAVDLLAKMDPAAKKIAIIHEKDKFSTDVVNALKSYAESKGYQVALFEGYEPGTTDFAPFINKIPAGVDAIMGGGHFADTSTFARQLAEKGVKAKMVALLVAPPEPKFAELGEAALGVIGPSQWEPAAKYTAEAAKEAKLEFFGPSITDFVKAYKAKYKGETPSYHSAGGYVAGLIIQYAIAKAGTVDTQAVKKVLDEMDLVTFYGRLKFDATPQNHGLQVGHDMILTQWQKDNPGKLVNQVVFPEAFKTAPVILYPRH
jgi:branched-chain amino acid transport system substrate-binding protein